MKKRKPGRPGRLTEEHIDWAYEKFLDGYPLLQVAKSLGVKRSNLQVLFFTRDMKKNIAATAVTAKLKGDAEMISCPCNKDYPKDCKDRGIKCRDCKAYSEYKETYINEHKTANWGKFDGYVAIRSEKCERKMRK